MRVRAKKARSSFKLFGEPGPLGPRVVQYVSQAAAELLVAQRKARRVHCERTGRCLGYALLGERTRKEKLVNALPLRSSAALTPREVEAIAGNRMRGGLNLAGVDGGRAGRSITQGMSEAGREARVRRGLAEMDLVEAAELKLAAWR